jgi:DNA-binding response OmpR family regulator
MDKTIVLLQNNDEYAEFLYKLLGEHNYIIKKAKDDLEVLNHMEELNPDLIISSYNLQNIDGTSFFTKISEDYPDMPILFISAERDVALIASLLKFPNCDFMVKPIVTEELLARIRVLITPNDFIINKKNPDKLKIKDLILNIKTKSVTRGTREIALTPKEYNLLEYLMFNKNAVLSRESILSKVWGTVTDVSDRIVDVYIGYLREKIDSGEKIKLIETVPGFGYCIKD